MEESNQKSKLQRGARALLFVVILVLVIAGLDFTCVDDSGRESRVQMADLYRQEKIETLLVGASHTRLGVDANLLTDLTGKACFSVCTAAQSPVINYWLLKETLENHSEIETVCFELSFPFYSEEAVQSATATYIISDYMRGCRNRFGLIFDSLNATDRICALIPIARSGYGDDYPNPVSVVKKKLTEAYRSADDSFMVSEYAGRGHTVDTWATPFSEKLAFVYEPGHACYPADKIDPEQLETLDRIIGLCREKGVELRAFTMPAADGLMALAPADYDGLAAFFGARMSEKSIPYVDFNLLSRKTLGLTDDLFEDEDHLNDGGAQIVTAVLAELIADGKTDAEAYATLSERLAAEGYAPVIAYNKLENRDTCMAYRIFPVSEQPLRLTAAVADESGKTLSGRDFSWETVLEPLERAEIAVPFSAQWGRMTITMTGTDGMPYGTADFLIG